MLMWWLLCRVVLFDSLRLCNYKSQRSYWQISSNCDSLLEFSLSNTLNRFKQKLKKRRIITLRMGSRSKSESFFIGENSFFFDHFIPLLGFFYYFRKYKSSFMWLFLLNFLCERSDLLRENYLKIQH